MGNFIPRSATIYRHFGGETHVFKHGSGDCIPRVAMSLHAEVPVCCVGSLQEVVLAAIRVIISHLL